MLKIQVLGKGMIPRGYGLAPRKEFFKADLNLIQTILLTPGLKVNMLSPEDNKIIAVTNANVKRLWDKYRSDNYQKPAVKVEVAEGKDDPAPVIKPEDIVAPKQDSPCNINVSMINTVNVEDPKSVESNETKPEVITPVKPVEAEVENKVEEKQDEAPAPIKPILNDNKNRNNHQNHNNHHKK